MKILLFCSLAVCVVAGAATPRLSLGPLMADGMVFPAGNGTVYGGGAAPHTSVLVNFTRAAKTNAVQGNADSRGNWAIHLQLSPSLTPGTITISSGKDSFLVLRGVLVGDLILCSGQSNMVFSVAAISCDERADPALSSAHCETVWLVEI